MLEGKILIGIWRKEYNHIRPHSSLGYRLLTPGGYRASCNTRNSNLASGTMGLFISINGWSDAALYVMRQNIHKNVVLMNGTDIKHILEDRVNLGELMEAKIKHFSLYAEPYFSASNLL